MNPLKSRIPAPEKTSSNVLPHGKKMPSTLTIIIPMSPMMRNPLRPDKFIFVVQPRRAVAVNINPVAISAFVSIIAPPDVARTSVMSGAIVIPVMNAKSAKRKRFSGLFLLHVLDVKIIPNSAAKSTYISHGYDRKNPMKYVYVTYNPAIDVKMASAKNVITLPKNVGSMPSFAAVVCGCGF